MNKVLFSSSFNSILKIEILVLLTLLIVACAKDEDAPSQNIENYDLPGYNLVWQDEFSGSSIDESKWEHEVNAGGGGNNEFQYYTSRKENSYIADGLLHIIAKKETYTDTEGTRGFTSARMRTLNRGDWKYGRFEIKAKLPYGRGLWPAIWMLPTDWVYGGWAASGEIDIMELVGHEPNVVYGTLHYGGEPPNNISSGDSYKMSLGSFADNYHLFVLEWEETEIRWYVDDFLYETQKIWRTTAAPYPAPFDQRFHLLLNVAVGGNWPGSPDETTVFPQEMVVDYVRVYEKK